MQREISVDMYAGGLVFWKSSMTSADSLNQVCTDLGIKVNWQVIDEAKGLELALRDRYARQGKLVRAAKPVELPRPDGKIDFCPSMVVVDESLQDKANAYSCSRCYWLDPLTWLVYYSEAGGSAQDAEHIDARRYRGQVQGASVGIGLEKIVEQVGGYKLRDNARIYYLPTVRMDRWAEVAAKFESLGMVFFRANCPADSETAAAVADNAAVELREKYERLLASIATQDQKLAANDSSKNVRQTASRKRAELLAELDAVKAEAAGIDASFRGLLNLAGEIGSEIDSAMALAILTTAN